MNFLEITPHELTDAIPGLVLSFKVAEGEPLYIYGLTSDQELLLAASNSIKHYSDAEELKPTIIAIVIEVSEHSLNDLNGSGYKLKEEAFFYNGGVGEGVRDANFTFLKRVPLVTLSKFTKIAISGSDAWADEFLSQHASEHTEVTRGKNSVDFHNPSSMDKFLGE